VNGGVSGRRWLVALQFGRRRRPQSPILGFRAGRSGCVIRANARSLTKLALGEGGRFEAAIRILIDLIADPEGLRYGAAGGA